MAPQIEALIGWPGRRQRWLAPGALAALALAFLVEAGLASGYSPAQPMPNGVWYELDTDSGQATWASFGDKPVDPWTAQFFMGAIERVDLESVYASVPGNPTPPGGFKGAAPVAALPAPELAVVSDQIAAGVRTLRLHLSSPRLARGLRVKLSGGRVLAATVNGNRQVNPAWADRDEWFLRYYGMTSQGIDLVLEVRPAGSLTLLVTDQSDGLPALPGVTYAPRGADMMPFAIAQEYMPYPETASVSKTFRLQ